MQDIQAELNDILKQKLQKILTTTLVKTTFNTTLLSKLIGIFEKVGNRECYYELT